MGKAVADIFFTPQDIIKATPKMITVDITKDKPQLTEIQYGVRVEDSQGKLLGTVDFIARDTVTGESRKFKVSKGKPGTEIFFAPEDILDATIDKVILRTTFDKLSYTQVYCEVPQVNKT